MQFELLDKTSAKSCQNFYETNRCYDPTLMVATTGLQGRQNWIDLGPIGQLTTGRQESCLIYVDPSYEIDGNRH